MSRAALPLVCALVLVAACGRVVPRGGQSPPALAAGAPRPRVFGAPDFIPADLDLVVRVDLTKVRASLGGELPALDDLPILAGVGLDAFVRDALARADVVWLASRVADIEEGDRVLAVEGSGGAPEARALANWSLHPTGVDGLARYASRTKPPRSGTAELYVLERAGLVLVSPVEASSVRRVVARGPDPERGQPEARGLVSLDYRRSAPLPQIFRRFRSLAGLLDGIVRVRATVDLRGTVLAVEARVACTSARSAEKLAAFMMAFRSAGRAELGAEDSAREDAQPREGAQPLEPAKEAAAHGELLRTLTATANDLTVTVRWDVPRDALAPLFAEPRAHETQPSTRAIRSDSTAP